MKKFFKNILGYVFIALIIFIPLAIAFQNIYDVVLKIGRGSLVAGIVLTPFVIIGVINIFRGIFAVLEMDEAKYGHKVGEGWKFSLYLLIHIGGYLAVFYAIINCI